MALTDIGAGIGKPSLLQTALPVQTIKQVTLVNTELENLREEYRPTFLSYFDGDVELYVT